MSDIAKDDSRGREPRRRDNTPQEEAISFLTSVEGAIDAKLDPLIVLSGTFRSGTVDVPRVSLTHHDGAGLLIFNVSTSELGRIAGAGLTHPFTDEQLGVGLLIQMREFLPSRIAGHVSSHAEKMPLSAAVVTYQGKRLRPPFSNTTEDSFLRIVVPIDEVKKNSEQVRQAIEGVNFVVNKILELGASEALAAAQHRYEPIPEADLEELEFPGGEPTEDEIIGDSFLPTEHLVKGDVASDDLWKKLETYADVAPRTDRAYRIFGDRHAPLVDHGTSIDVRLLLSAEEVGLYRRIGIAEPEEFLREDLERMSRELRVRGKDCLDKWLSISCVRGAVPSDYLHFRLVFESGPAEDDGAALKFERSYVLGHVVSLLAARGIRGIFRQDLDAHQ